MLALPLSTIAGGTAPEAAKAPAKPAAAAATPSPATNTPAATNAPNVLFKTQGKFQDVRDAVVMAIEGKGLKITNTNHIATMLDRTGQDLGLKTKIYEHAEQMEFCSAIVSRDMMKADPHAIVMCPYNIAVYQIPNDKTIYIAFRKPPASKNPALQKALTDVENLLRDIIKDAI